MKVEEIKLAFETNVQFASISDQILQKRLEIRKSLGMVNDSVDRALSLNKDSAVSIDEMKKLVDKALALENELGAKNTYTPKYLDEVKSYNDFWWSVNNNLTKVKMFK